MGSHRSPPPKPSLLWRMNPGKPTKHINWKFSVLKVENRVGKEDTKMGSFLWMGRWSVSPGLLHLQGESRKRPLSWLHSLEAYAPLATAVSFSAHPPYSPLHPSAPFLGWSLQLSQPKSTQTRNWVLIPPAPCYSATGRWRRE